MHLQPVDLPEMEPFISGAIPLEQSTVQDPLDDVFGVDNSPLTSHEPTDVGDTRIVSEHAHPSDMHRLQAEHSTSGYREGITAGKALSVQAGFDEGFGLGTTIGSKAGQLLGILEGIASALADQDLGASADLARLLDDARAELKTEKIFGPDYFAPDGTWVYPVKAGSINGDSEEIIFADVASGHPLIQKWSKLIEYEIERWGLDLHPVVFSEHDPERQHTPEERATATTNSSAAEQLQNPLAW
jgi:hypothetical protein